MQFQIGLISSYSSYQWPSWGCCAVFGGGYAFLADLLWIGGCRGCGMHWCLAWLAGCAGRGVRLHLRSFWWFARISGGGGQGFGPLIYLNGRAEGEIHLNGLFLAGADVCGFLYSSIGCLQVYRVYITSF